jgi:hypothetical protein
MNHVFSHSGRLIVGEKEAALMRLTPTTSQNHESKTDNEK